jgi:hypothetical protein
VGDGQGKHTYVTAPLLAVNAGLAATWKLAAVLASYYIRKVPHILTEASHVGLADLGTRIEVTTDPVAK